ncbi:MULTISPECIES: FecR family protein [Olivibacter]|jgi:ferric-dicitrate binding protein FerR (iron transport regulator)|uniref:FecR family protein n=2 Tax=Olivibacter TaxID=376469 RepID=A0ABV6HIR5_9SPHI|nr:MULTISPECIES: FecR family protein [Olivibacter]MCL4642320.1 FecR family protein [Olivibacter sp. UJ_SKK_5.1]MDX3913501.1 FecR family protein [Pseudosphingobacterium sp.]QEL01533.1 FecR family protein [Olivibacter sp. LS-1]
MKSEISEALIEKYLNKQCNAEEVKLVEAWYDAMGNSLSAEEFDQIRKNSLLKARMLYNIKRRSGLSLHNGSEGAPFKKVHRKNRSTGVWAAAAAIVLIAFIWLLLGGQLDKIFKTDPVVLVKNESKTILKHHLPDGSVIWLAPHSSLQYSGTFQQGVREVTMRGDVFFEVAKDPNKPFLINSGSLLTKVLGTSFRIRSAGDAEEEVSVVTGMVAVSRVDENISVAEKMQGSREVLLVADQKVHFNKHKAHLVKTKETSRSSVKMWKKRSMSFEDKPLKDIAHLLDSTFNVQIDFQDKKLESYTLTADFNQLNLISIMEIISQSLNLQYEISGDRIRLIKK